MAGDGSRGLTRRISDGQALSFALGGFALALYGPFCSCPRTKLTEYQNWWIKTLTAEWYTKIFTLGPGIFAGLALLFLAIRSKD